MNPHYDINTTDDITAEQWNHFLKGRPIKTPLNTFEWTKILASTYRPEQKNFYAKDQAGEIVGILPTYLTKTPKGKNLLYSYRQGMIAENETVARLLAKEALRYANKKNAIKAEISSGLSAFDLNAKMTERCTVHMDLSKDTEALWKAMRDKTRNVIRKAEKHHLVIKQGHQYLKQFYKIYSNRMLEKKIPHPSCHFFSALLDQFGSKASLYVAYYQQTPIASMLIIRFSTVAVYAYGGMNSAFRKYCPNQFLLWHIIQEVKQQGVTLLDLGESKPGSGVYKFKTWFGGVPKPVYYYELLKQPGKSQDLSENQPISNRSLLAFAYETVINLSPKFIGKMLLKKMKHYGRLI